MNFYSQWLKRFELSPENWLQEAEQCFEALSFISKETALPLVEFLFNEVPEILASCNDSQTMLIANAYAWCCFAFWQCESAFPALPENYAAHLKAALVLPPSNRDRCSVLLSRMIVEFNTEEGQCGFNRLALADAECIRESERRNLDGRFEIYLKTPEKYEEYVYLLENSEEFREEWKLIKATYGYFLTDKSIMRRSSIPERNWLRGASGAQFMEPWLRFKAVFDLFCWKYYLWGMEGDKPLLLKVSAVCTPHGTQIFIPGYLSIDLNRDLNFALIRDLHRARGISRQGPGHSIGRRERAELRLKAKAADSEARRQGLKGEARYSFISAEINYPDSGDFRRLRALLADERRKTEVTKGKRSIQKK